MAMALEHRFSNGNLNTYGHHANGKYAAAQHHILADDDSIATEQFPAFDPSHDGSEEEMNDGEFYTHSAAKHPDGAASEDNQKRGNLPDPDEEVEVEVEEEDHHHRTPLFSVDPVPEQDYHHGHYDVDHRDDESTTTTQTMISPITSPPYWAHGHTNSNNASPHPNYNLSTESLILGAITLQDNEADDDADVEPSERRRNSEETRTSYGRDRNKACWAKSVEVTDYVIVNGSATNIGAFVVWNIRVQTLSGPYMNIRKRYSEFDDFRHRLIQTFPNFEAAVPVLPRKSVISRFSSKFLEKRRAGLQYFLNCILLNPEFSGSPVLKDFLFS